MGEKRADASFFLHSLSPPPSHTARHRRPACSSPLSLAPSWAWRLRQVSLKEGRVGRRQGRSREWLAAAAARGEALTPSRRAARQGGATPLRQHFAHHGRCSGCVAMHVMECRWATAECLAPRVARGERGTQTCSQSARAGRAARAWCVSFPTRRTHAFHTTTRPKSTLAALPGCHFILVW